LTIVDLISTAVTICVLAYGSWSDLMTREVPDRLWIVFAPVACALMFTRIWLSPELAVILIVSAALTALLSVAIFYIGLYGGADAKALICVGLANPTFPLLMKPLLGSFHPFFPIVMFTNSVLCSLLVLLYVASRNLERWLSSRGSFFNGFKVESFWRKLLASICGYKVDFSVLEDRLYLYPMENVQEKDGEVERRLRVHFRAEEDRDKLVGNLKQYVSRGIVPSEVWVTPGIPMIVFFLAGYALTMVFGDILVYGILQLLTFLAAVPR